MLNALKSLTNGFKRYKKKFNGVVLFVREGNPLLAKGYGYADAKKEVPLTKHSALRLASVSKQFTAAGIMLMKEKGLLQYDQPVSNYINGFPYEGVTVRHLLNQTSGIPDIYMDLAFDHEAEIELLTNEIAVDLIIKENRKAFAAPNEVYAYSNTNYLILARVIEVISGLSFEAFMKKELFLPLDMKDTRVWNLKSLDKNFPNKASDLDNFNGKFSEMEPSFLDGVAGDGGVFTSISDMIKWDQFWYENPLISEANLKEAFIEPTLSTGEKSDYGFGWVITKRGSWHNGSWLGANTMISRNTKQKTCMVVLDNTSNIFIDPILDALYKVWK